MLGMHVPVMSQLYKNYKHLLSVQNNIYLLWFLMGRFTWCTPVSCIGFGTALKKGTSSGTSIESWISTLMFTSGIMISLIFLVVNWIILIGNNFISNSSLLLTSASFTGQFIMKRRKILRKIIVVSNRWMDRFTCTVIIQGLQRTYIYWTLARQL